MPLVFREPNAWGYALLVFESLLSLALLLLARRDFCRLDGRRLLLLVVSLLAPLASEHLLVVEFAGRRLLPLPGIPVAPPEPLAPLLGMLPIAVAGAWLGPGPALLTGLVKGILRAGMTSGAPVESVPLVLRGFVVGSLLRQDYRGRVPRLARQPIAALPLMTPIPALLLLISGFARAAASGLSGLDYAASLTASHFLPLLLESAVAAMLVQAFYLALPRLRPVRVTSRWPPYSRTLNRRLLFLFIPLVALIAVVLVYAVTATALRQATAEAVRQMARDANSAAAEIPHFVQTGQGLLAEFAEDEGLWRGDPNALQERLRRDMQMVVFFEQLLLFDADGHLLAQYPPAPVGDPRLTSQEQTLVELGLEDGAPQISQVHRSRQGVVILTFLAPMSALSDSDQGAAVSRVLLGRTYLDANPVVGRIVDGLQWADGRGAGFIVDSRGRIVVHPIPDMLLRVWEFDDAQGRIDSPEPGWAYRSRDSRDNTRQIVYRAPVEGYPWQVVIRLPHAVVLEQAREIATPLLGLQILLGGGLVVIVSLVTNWVTQPLKQLATAADRMAAGDLYEGVHVAGQDEVARLGDAFEEMRVRLKDRMEGLSLLLQVSRAVSGTLSLVEGMPFILEGALRALDAQVARMVFLGSDGEPCEVIGRGELCDGLDQLDRALAHVARRRNRPMVIENLRRARSFVETSTTKMGVSALVALPVQSRNELSGVMWIGYRTPQDFDASDIDLLSTLASQTSILVENARLFDTAEGERRRLAAILASTNDAVVVTDSDHRLLLINPAAERSFGVTGGNIVGRPVADVPLPATLRDVLQEPPEVVDGHSRELALADGRTLYASVSAILSNDGNRLGRVAVMRDITHLKELDELKSEFVSTVSHDLRSPLTLVRGYTGMLATAGQLNEDQKEYLEKVLKGVDQISNLVEDLLDLRRVESGIGFEAQPCKLVAIVSEGVDARRMRATAKDVDLRLKSEIWDQSSTPPAMVDPRSVIVLGDAASLRQAVTNLVDNAIKYTPSGGQVRVRVSVEQAGTSSSADGPGRALIHVADTGIGIAPADQVRLFERFYRVRRADVPNVPGTGLGLSLVRSIIERHRGEISVESELNQGSTFCVSLPLAPPGSGTV